MLSQDIAGLYLALQQRAPTVTFVFMTAHQKDTFAEGLLPDGAKVLQKLFGLSDLTTTINALN